MSNDPSYFFKTLPLPEKLKPIGSLHTTPSYLLLHWIATDQFTGRLILEREQRVKHLYFSKGQLISIRSNLIMEGIDMMLKQGFLDPQYVVQIQQQVVASTLDEDWEDRMIHHILAQGHLTKEDLIKVLELQTKEQLLNAFGWLEGKYFIKPMQEVAPRFSFYPSAIDLTQFIHDLDLFFAKGIVTNIFPHVDQKNLPHGEIHTVGGGTLISHFSALQVDGKLSLKRGRKRKNILFKQGRIFSVSTSDPKETLEMILEKWNFLPKDIIQSIASQVRVNGGKLRSTLLEQKLLPEQELKVALRLLHIERILDIFSWRSGYFEWFSSTAQERFDEEEKTSAESTKLHKNPADTMLTVCKRYKKPNILILEPHPMESAEKAEFLKFFAEQDRPWAKFFITDQKQKEGSPLRYVPESQFLQAAQHSMQQGFKILAFCETMPTTLIVPEYFCTFLIVSPDLHYEEILSQKIDLSKPPALHGFFDKIYSSLRD